MSDVPYILSLAHKQKIDEACKPLSNLGLKHFVMYIVFNDGTPFILSNAHPILKPYYHDALYKEDYTYRPSMIDSVAQGYYLCDDVPSISSNLKMLFAKKYSLYPVYNIIRRHPECTFVFSAIRDVQTDSSQLFYDKTISQFESFCIQFVDKFIDLIIACNPSYKYAFILNNKRLRDAVIREGYDENITISAREQECLWHRALGKSAKQIAKELNISHLTVERHLKHIKEIFNCNEMAEILVEGIHRGLIGRFTTFSKKQQNIISINQNIARPNGMHVA